ncbi:hypothetical protein B0J14DRAFT_677372 [Halenospora varia]|nr:hypothetical protein B0J14DRAFT_677372 [Halenospora varia]
MNLKVEVCSDSDMPKAFELLRLAFAGRKVGALRMLAAKNSDPCTNLLKVVDKDSGTMITNGEGKEYAQLLCREYLIPRRKIIRDSGGGLFSLDLLVVDLMYQRRGAGRMLVRWGTTHADEVGFAIVVQSTEYGRSLYESEGFKFANR